LNLIPIKYLMTKAMYFQFISTRHYNTSDNLVRQTVQISIYAMFTINSNCLKNFKSSFKHNTEALFKILVF
jgi:hypothetical protein